MTTAARPDIIRFAREVLHVEPYPKQLDALQAILGHQLSVLVLGRRSGKSLMAAIVAVFDALCREEEFRPFLRPGERRYCCIVATSSDQARRVFTAVRDFFNLPELAPLVVRESLDELELATGVVIKTLPCSSRSARGLAISTLILDEAAHFIDADGYQSGEEIWRALSPSVAQFGDAGKVIVLSTPRGERGLLWKLWQVDDPGTFRLQASTAAMNPTIAAAFLDREAARDDFLFRQEYEAQFLEGGSNYLPLSLLRQCAGVPQHTCKKRIMAIDPAFTMDAFGVAVACWDGEKHHIERVEALQPPVDFAGAMDRVAALHREVQPSELWTDQFSSTSIISELHRRGVYCRALAWHQVLKADAFTVLKSYLTTGELRLVDDEELLHELASLTITPTAQAFQIEASGARDDIATAAAMALYQLVRHTKYHRPKAPGDGKFHPSAWAMRDVNRYEEELGRFHRVGGYHHERWKRDNYCPECAKLYEERQAALERQRMEEYQAKQAARQGRSE